MIKNRVFRNASWLIGCRIIQSILNLVISTLTARFMGPSNFGVINYAASVVAFFAPLMFLGINSVIVQEITTHPEEEGKITGTSMLLNIISALVSMFGVTAFAAIVNRGETETIIVCALYSINLLFQATEMLRYWYQAKLQSKYVAIISLLAYVVTSAYKVYLLATGKSIYWFAISYAIDYALISLGLYIVYRRKYGGKLQLDRKIGKRLLVKGRYYIVSDLMVAVFAQISKIVLKLVMNEAAVGIYSIALTCSGMTGFVFVAISDSFRPVIFGQKKYNNVEFKKSVRLLYSIFFYLSLAQAVFFTLFADVIVGYMYGPAYADAVVVLKILIWMIPPGLVGTVRNIWILAEEKQQYLWIINLCGALFSLAATVVFIYFFGLIGAAVSTLLTQVFTNVILGWIIKPIRPNNRLMIEALNPLVLWRAVKKLI